MQELWSFFFHDIDIYYTRNVQSDSIRAKVFVNNPTFGLLCKCSGIFLERTRRITLQSPWQWHDHETETSFIFACIKAAKYEIQKPSTAQHCFVPRFGRCFAFFTLLDQLDPQKNIYCGLKKCDALIGWFARARANLLRDKLGVWWKTSNKAQNLLLKVDPRSTFRNNFPQPATNVLVARQVSDHARWKTVNIDKTLRLVSRISLP